MHTCTVELDQQWVTRATRYVHIDLTLYNPASSVLAATRLTVHFSHTGATDTSADFRSFLASTTRFPPSIWFELAFALVLIVQVPSNTASLN